MQVYIINEQSVSCFSFEFFSASSACWSDEWTNNDEERKSECKSVTRQEWKKDSIFGRKFLTEIKSTNTKDVTEL